MLQIALEKPGSFRASQTDQPASSPPAGYALVRVHRIGVCGTDLHAFAGNQPFFSYPRVLGHELGVEVIEVNPNNRGIKPGDRCSVEPYLNCGKCVACTRGKTNCCESLQVLGVHVDGGMQPLITIPVNKLHKSDKLSLDQLALVETLAIGAHAVERAAPTDRDTALVIGAGPIGLGVMQSLLARGIHTIAMDVDDSRLDFCRHTLGIDRTVNATAATLEDDLKAHARGDLPTLIIDATGHPKSMARTFDLAAPGGRIVFVGLFQGDVTFHDPHFHKRELTLLASRNAPASTFIDLIHRIEAGQIDTTAWVTHRLKLADVPDKFPTLPGAAGLIKAIIEVDPE